MLEQLKQTRMVVKVALAIIWLLYIPFALIIFAFSGLGFDAGSNSWSSFAFLLINGIPLAVMLTASRFALKRNSTLIALSPILIFFLIWACMWVIVNFFGPR